MESGIGKRRLRFDRGHAEHTHPGGAGYRLLQQRRLADPRLADDDEGSRPSATARFEECVDAGVLDLPPHQHAPTLLVWPGLGKRPRRTRATTRILGRMTRILLLTALVAAAPISVARSSVAASTNCGTVKGGGATWSVVAAGGISCRTARPLVQSLAAKPHPGVATRLGTHLGLRCTEVARGKTREIACLSPDGRKSVLGATPPHS